MSISPSKALQLAALSAVVFASGCLESNRNCTPGREIGCTCANGSEGSQLCLEDRTYDSCFCDGEYSPDRDAASSRDAASGRDAAVDGGPGRDATVDASVPQPADTIASGNSTLIDVFAQGTDVWVVDAAGVSLMALSGGPPRATWTAPRPITAAAFDGTHLVVMDGAKLNTLKASDLTLVTDGTLLESCANAVLVSRSRVVCGPANDWDRVFYTYDALNGQLLASSTKYTYNGIPMRVVPGMDAFVTVTVGTSPSDFHLYNVGEDNAAKFVNESPYHGDFTANMVFAFDGAQPENLINAQGLLLRFSASCSAGSSFESQCFVKNGALGTLTGAQRFVALDNADTLLVGLVDPSGSNYYDPYRDAGAGYVLQSIDVPSRIIETQRVVQLSLGRVVAFRALPDQGVAVLGTSTGNNAPFEPAPAGYTVLRLALDE